MATQKFLDKNTNRLIVSGNKKSPSEGAGNTNRGLTSQADTDSMAAMRNSIPAPSSRQSLSTAADGFFVRDVEYIAPPDKVVRGYVMDVCNELASQHPEFSGVEIRQGFLQFVNLLIRIQVKQANKGSTK